MTSSRGGAADEPLTYRSSGVDIAAGEHAVERIKRHVRSTFRPEGVVERGALLPRDVGLHDRVVGVASPGLRCNGYSLARRALLDRAYRSLDDPAWSDARHSLGEELLRPSVVYAKALLALARRVEVH